MSELLSGLTVVDLTAAMAVPGAATLMADHGADVIRVESPVDESMTTFPFGEDQAYRLQLSTRQLSTRQQRVICLNLKLEQAQDVLCRLIETADVLLIDYPGERIRALQLDHGTMMARNPRLVYAQLSTYGSVGPDKDRPATDATAWWARSGLLDTLAVNGSQPGYPLAGIGNQSSAMTLFAAVMMALYQRQQTGKGGYVATSLVADGCWSNAISLQREIASVDVGQEAANDRPMLSNIYKTRDARYILLQLDNLVSNWASVAGIIGHPEWVEDERFVDRSALIKYQSEVQQLVTQAIGAINLADLCLAFDQKQIVYSAIESVEDVVRDAHLIENQVIVKTGSEDSGYQWTVANPIQVEAEPQKKPIRIPRSGEHTREILQGAGYSTEIIEQLLADGVAVARETSADS